MALLDLQYLLTFKLESHRQHITTHTQKSPSRNLREVKTCLVTKISKAVVVEAADSEEEAEAVVVVVVSIDTKPSLEAIPLNKLKLLASGAMT